MTSTAIQQKDNWECMLNRLEAKIAEDPHYVKRILKLQSKKGELEQLTVDWETWRKQHHEKKFDSWDEQGQNLQTIKDDVYENFGITDALLRSNVQLKKEAVVIQELKEQSKSIANMFDEMPVTKNEEPKVVMIKQPSSVYVFDQVFNGRQVFWAVHEIIEDVQIDAAHGQGNGLDEFWVDNHIFPANECFKSKPLESILFDSNKVALNDRWKLLSNYIVLQFKHFDPGISVGKVEKIGDIVFMIENEHPTTFKGEFWQACVRVRVMTKFDYPSMLCTTVQALDKCSFGDSHFHIVDLNKNIWKFSLHITCALAFKVKIMGTAGGRDKFIIVKLLGCTQHILLLTMVMFIKATGIAIAKSSTDPLNVLLLLYSLFDPWGQGSSEGRGNDITRREANNEGNTEGAKRDWVDFYGECANVLYQGIDYTKEAANLELFARDFKDMDVVKFPSLYWKCTTPSVLTRKYVPEIKINKIQALDQLEVGRKRCNKIFQQSTGQVVDVKQLDSTWLQVDKEFFLEVLMLILRHHNFVKLIDYFVKGDQHHLIYEYMRQGSLKDHFNHVILDQNPLEWNTKMTIFNSYGVVLMLMELLTGLTIHHRLAKRAMRNVWSNHLKIFSDFIQVKDG
ncbi:hypothetical protein GQ457_04G021120 [Hibiscus cannabinus]